MRPLLQSNKLPAHLLVIGGGAVGLEFATTMYAGFGSHVTLLEAGNRFLPKVDHQPLPASMLEALNRKTYQCPVERPCPIRVRHSRRNNSDLRMDSANGTPYYLKGDALLVAIGRKPMTAELNLEKRVYKQTSREPSLSTTTDTDYSPHVWARGT